MASAQVSNCIGFCGLVVADYSTFTFSATVTPGISLVMNRTLAWVLPPSGGGIGGMWASLNLSASAVISIAWTAGGDAGGTPSASASLYSCDGTLIETVSSTSTPLVFSPLATDGEYIITIDGGGEISLFGGSSFINSTLTVSSDFSINPVIALWDNSGTTEQFPCSTPECSIECISEETSEFCAPSSGTQCEAFYFADDPPCGETIQSSQVRAIVTGLIPGVYYEVSVIVVCDSCGPLIGPGYTLTWCFLATSETETTDYQGLAIAAEDGCDCRAISCSVTHVCKCA